MANRNGTRSSLYQNLLLEISTNPMVLNDLSLAQGMTYRIRPDVYDERYLDLRDKLKVRMWELIKELTERQQQVIRLSVEGFTQNEIAKKLGINQTSVHKVLRGNIDYKSKNKDNSEKHVRYGGAFKKLIKLCAADPEIQEILNEMWELQECLEL